MTDPAQSFEPYRGTLTRLAYRMLGSLAEAEDIVQEAFLRWLGTDRTRVNTPRAFLERTVTRLCLDHMKSARQRHETYIGPWLPEPIIHPETVLADEIADKAAALSTTLMLALERLSPLERAAFLLHDVFDVDFSQVAQTLGRSETACRQLASRARQHVQQARPRFPMPVDQGLELAEAFLHAAHQGDLSKLTGLLAQAAIVVTDGGGVRSAALNPILGRERLLRFFSGLARKGNYYVPPILYLGPIDNLPGYVTLEADGLPQSTTFAIDQGVITAIYIVRNPAKLAGLLAHKSPSTTLPVV